MLVQKKSQLRKQVKEMLLSMSEKECASRSRRVIKKLMQAEEFVKANTIFCYASNGWEVQTHELIKAALKTKTVLIPRLNNECIELTLFKQFEALKPNKYGILEDPNSVKFNELNSIDLIIVPGVAFDRFGNRLGRGLGCYDTFMRDFRAPRIALAFAEQILDKIPTEAHDERVHKIITDSEIINCLE